MTTNIELENASNKLKLKNFRGVYMRDELKFKPLKKECGILNLDCSKNSGTHWVAWFKDEKDKIYFDSFGVQPPLELIKYLKSPILYNTFQIQNYNDTNCGEWCLYVLKELNKGRDYIDIICDIINGK